MPFDGIPALNEATIILQMARRYIEQGWCQESIVYYKVGESHPQFCAVGAVRQAHNRFFNDFDYLETAHPGDAIARRYLEPSLPFFYRRIMPLLNRQRQNLIFTYNDGFWRSKREILALFDRAIARSLTETMVSV